MKLSHIMAFVIGLPIGATIASKAFSGSIFFFLGVCIGLFFLALVNVDRHNKYKEQTETLDSYLDTIIMLNAKIKHLENKNARSM